MNDSELALNLAAFLDPAVVMESVRRYDEERKQALTPAGLIIGSGHLTSGDEGNYAELVRQFLRGFKPPGSLVSLLRALNGTRGFSWSSWRWLEELSLSCEIKVFSHGSTPEGFPGNTIMIVRERDAVIDLIRDPLFALLDMVGRASVHWREVAKLGARHYFSGNSPSPFYTYVEHRAASYFVEFVDQSHLDSKSNLKNRYRAVTVTGMVAADSPLWGVARDAARIAAASTLEPLKEEYR